MGRKSELSCEVRSQIVALNNEGLSSRAIASRLKCHHATVVRTINRHSEQENFNSRPRSGRPSVFTPRTTRVVKRLVTDDPRLTSAGVRKHLSECNYFPENKLPSTRTIRDLLCRKLKLRARRPARKPLLNEVQRKRRLAFCRKYCKWTVDHWKKVLFSDECTFQQFGAYVSWVRRPAYCRFLSKYTISTMKHPASIMVWGCFSWHGRGRLYFVPKGRTVNSKVYQEILQEKMLPCMDSHQTTIFQQDNAPCHTSKAMQTFFRQTKINVLEWPGNSPDINPIENLWLIMKKKVASRHPKNIEDLKTAIKEVWVKEVAEDVCHRLVESLPTLLQEVIWNKGYSSRY